MFKKKLGFLAGVMFFLSVAGYIICLLAGGKQWKKEDEFVLVTSFYPMYVLAENLTAGVDGAEVYNLTENQTGCLHDYQLTSKDMKLLAQADAFLIHGAGMELFMEKVLENNPQLPVIEASVGISLLEGQGHTHNHGEAGHEEQKTTDSEPEHEEHGSLETDETGHQHEENGHVWMDVKRYRMELSTVKEALLTLLPEDKEALEQAAASYDRKLVELSDAVAELKADTAGIPVVIFHEAFAYFAESLDMEVLVALSLDEETVPSAGEIAEVIEEIRYHGSALILIEETYASYAEKILAETEAEVVYLDPLTTGDGSADSYIAGMQNNLASLEEAVHGLNSSRSEK